MNDEEFFAQLEKISENYNQDEILKILRDADNFGEEYAVKAQDYFSKLNQGIPNVTESISQNEPKPSIPEPVKEQSEIDSFWIVDEDPNELQKIWNSGIASGALANIIAKSEAGADLDYDKLVYYNKVLKDNQPKQGDVLQSDALIAGFALDVLRVVPQSLISMATAAPAGAIGAGAGAATGAAYGSLFLPGAGSAVGATTGALSGFAGASSLAIEYANSMMASLQEAGVDIYNDDLLESAFKDPQKMSEAREYGLKRGIPIAVFDAISGGTGGKIAKAVKKAGRGKLKQAAAEVGVQGVLGSAGETAGQLVAGDELSPRDILLEGFAELAPATPGMIVEYAKTVSKNKALPENAKIDGDISDKIKEENDARPEGEKLSPDQVDEKIERTLLDASRVPEFIVSINKKSKSIDENIKTLEGSLLEEDSAANIERVQSDLTKERRKKEDLIRKTKLAFTNLPAEAREEVQRILAEIDSAPTAQSSSGYYLKENQRLKSRLAQIFKDNILAQKEGVVTPKVPMVKLSSDRDTKDVRFRLKTDLDSDLKIDDNLSKASGRTQRKNTRPSYVKAAEIVNDLEIKGDVLDYGAGLGIGTDAMTDVLGRKVESFEINTEKWEGEAKPTYTSTKDINKKYDSIVSLNVVNVVPKNVRDFIVTDIFEKLNEGGTAIISSRGFKGDVSTAKNFELGPEEKSYLIEVSGEQQYQKGFDGNELVDYVQELLGDNATVTKNNTFGKTGIIVTKNQKSSQQKITESTNVLDIAEVTDVINEIDSPNKEVQLGFQSSSPINVNELNKRTDTPLKSTTLSILDGIPTIFTITDQLTTGNTVNPETGNKIDQLKGAIGFNGTKGNQNIAWANVGEDQANNVVSKATKLFKENRSVYEKWWASNPEYNGLVPMNVVKMGEVSMLSNEATFRVLADNISTLPSINRENALNVLKSEINSEIEKLSSIKDPIKKQLKILNQYKLINSKISSSDIVSIDQVISSNLISSFPLPVRVLLINKIAYGSVNTPGIKPTSAGKPSKSVPKALLKGQPEGARTKLNIGVITDTITDPQLKNVPIGNVVSLVGVDVLNPEVLKTTHPNYKYGAKGRSIGILENPVPMDKAYPKTYEKSFKSLLAKESKGIKASGPSITSEQSNVGIGITSLDYVGAMTSSVPENVNKLVSFLSKVFPNVTLSVDLKEFNDIINTEGVKKYLKGNEVVYGVTVNGSVYVNPEVHNSESALFNTAIHEMGHVWTDFLQTTKKGKDIYNKGVDLVKETDVYKEQLEIFNGDVDKAANEALAILIGNKGETITSGAINSNFKEWLLGLWNYVKQEFKLSKDLSVQDVQNLTLDQFLGTALADVLSGNEIKTTAKQQEAMKSSAEFKQSDQAAEKRQKLQEEIDDFNLFNIISSIKLPDPKKWKKTERTGFKKFILDLRKKIQDKYINILKLEEDVKESLSSEGRTLRENQELTDSLSVYESKTESQLQEALEGTINNVTSLLKKAGVSFEKFGDVLYALTAIERNRELSKRVQDKKVKSDKNSGMSDVEAKEILESVGVRVQLDDSGVALTNPNHNEIKNKSLRYAVDENLKLLENMRNRGVESGIYSKELIDTYEKQFKYYVPLRGFEDPDIKAKATKPSVKKSISGGLRIGDPFLEMEGRTTKAENPFASSLALAASVIINANKNEVKQKLFNLAEGNPNSNVWKTIIPPEDGVEKLKNEFRNSDKTSGLVNMFFEGREVFVEMMDKGMADTMNGTAASTPSQFENALNTFAVVNRYLSMLITSYNPEFILGNFTRDMPTAIFNLLASSEIDLGGSGSAKANKLAISAVSNVMSSMGTIFKMEGIKPGKRKEGKETKLEKRYREFKEDGAKTGWFYAKTPEEFAKSIEGLMSEKGSGRKTLKALTDYVDRINTSVENAIRLSTYSALIDAGVPRAKSAAIAKELTVNFNKTGEWGRAANSLYLFFNASTQGTARLLKSLKPRYEISEGGDKKLVVTNGQYMALGIVTLGAMNSLMNEMMSDKDEDDESYYSKIPEYIRERNIVIMNPLSEKKGDYLKIPLPYGLNVFYVIGNSLSNAAQGVQSQNSIANQVFQTAAGSFSPINYPNSESTTNFMLKFISPTIGQPFLATGLNENYFGSSVYNENFPLSRAPKPDSELGRGRRTFFESTAKGLNKISGGDKYTAGFVDVNPDLMAFWSDFMFGGTGKFIRRSSELPGKLFAEKDVDPKEVPFLRVFYAQTDDRETVNKYYEDILTVGQLYKKAKEGGFDNESDRNSIVKMNRVSKLVTSKLRKIKKAEDLADKIEDAEKRQDRFDYLEKLENEEIKKFLRAYKKYKIDDLR